MAIDRNDFDDQPVLRILSDIAGQPGCLELTKPDPDESDSVAWLLFDGRDGWLLDKHDVYALANALLKLANAHD